MAARHLHHDLPGVPPPMGRYLLDQPADKKLDSRRDGLCPSKRDDDIEAVSGAN
jgi:hypothetical protein